MAIKKITDNKDWQGCGEKGNFCIVNEAKVGIFLESPCFLYDPTNVSNLISGSSAFSKPSLYIWKFSVPQTAEAELKGVQ